MTYLTKSIILAAVVLSMSASILMGAKVEKTAAEIKLQISEDDIVAATLILEAGGEGAKGMTAVAEIIRNRANAKSDIRSAICLKPKQFSCWNDRSIQDGVAKAKKHKLWDTAKTLVYTKTSIVGGANHYCRTDCFPKWRDDSKSTVVIKNHIFFKL